VNVFVLSTGRCASTTIARAFSHATNYTSSHESRVGALHGRLDYPPHHIESDNRLTWFLAPLDERFDDGVHWIHLTRNLDAVVESYWRRWEAVVEQHRVTRLVRNPRHAYHVAREWQQGPTAVFRNSIASAFGYGVVQSDRPLTSAERRTACELYATTAHATISHFVAGRDNVSRIDLENLSGDFAGAWDAIGAEGPIDRALSELVVHHNARTG
jgi:hypothetical protein